jgi:carbohydrate esterase-like sialic acid-specific acetylesterase
MLAKALVARKGMIMLKTLSIGLAACIALYLFGVVSDRHGIFPAPQLISLREKVRPIKVTPESRYTLDAQDRLIGDAEKRAAACPRQADRTAVLLVLGQSNAANYGGQRFASKHGDKIVNFFDGQCYVAASPLLGSGGTKGEYWTELGNHLIESGKFDTVVIAPVAYSGTAVARWARGGDLNAVLVETLSKIKANGYAITHVLWDQGELDYVLGTGEDAYRERLLSMIDTLRREGVTAPVYLSIASKCLEPSNGGMRRHSPDNPVVRAQLALSSGEDNIRRGVNTDAVLDELDRYDDCHIGGVGAEKVAQAWADILLGQEKQ